MGHRHIDDDDSPYDANGLLKDGRRVRISMQMRDAALRDLPLHDGRGNRCGHRPGFLIANDATARDARLRAYHDYTRDLENAYKNPPTGFGSKGPRGQQEGDICTINGAPGHLEMRGGALVCVPDRRSDQLDPASDRRSVADAYAEYDAKLREAWRNPQ
jgi:hypothetical protein